MKDLLAQPIAALMRQLPVIYAEDSIQRAVLHIRDGFDVVGVVRGPDTVGIVTESTLARALANGHTPYESAEVAATADVRKVDSQITGAEALRIIASGWDGPLIVMDQRERPIGVLSAKDLYPNNQRSVRPPMVGGMATPFGVYLTSGGMAAGPGPLALMSTGASLYLLSLAAWYVTEGIASLGHSGKYWAMAIDVMPLLLFMVGMRLLPLAGIHAAEHKVVHAIERGEDLVPEVVKRMPRVHPRCGTNLFVGCSLFLGVQGAGIFQDPSLNLLLAAIVTAFLWRKLGGFVQWLITTKPPSDKQIEMGIRSGKELLAKYERTRGGIPSIWQRLWYSGMFFVLLGMLIVEGSAYLLQHFAHVHIPIL